jgi:hypothetical protein
MFKAPIFSVAGIFQITSRASFFFDSMLAFGSRTTKSTHSTSTGGFDSPYVVTIIEGPQSTEEFIALYIMPGMRFQRNDNRAFQIAIAGVSVWDGGDTYTFPLPMVSWLFKF